MDGETSSTPSAPLETQTVNAAGEVLDEERVREELRNVIDPEIGLDMVSLGLLYGVKVADGVVDLTMTLTTPMCPYGPQFLASVDACVRALPGVKDVKVDLVFSPPWDPRAMASDDAKMMLGLYY